MQTQELTIKNMVCPRCVAAVRKVFLDHGLSIISATLGAVIVKGTLSDGQRSDIESALKLAGFELLNDRQSQLISRIKSLIIEQIHHHSNDANVNFSTYLTDHLPYDYAYLSRLFSAVEGRTIERFVMMQKIEKVKELLTYDELTLSEIAFQLHYSSSAHLSAQFKKITGMTPSTFKNLQRQDRTSLDSL